MPGKTRKFAQLSPQKQRQSPAKFLRLTEHDEASERRERTATKIAKEHERAMSIVQLSSPLKSASNNATPTTPNRGGVPNSSSQSVSTPVMKMPILANFEEWMKMATDNKINAGNSWNFALIDYFHEMSLLREGDSINFQKASVTLDGCVKIYTNRVDSVATETGKLLSGLSSNKQNNADAVENEIGEGEDGEDIDGNGEARRVKKRSTKTGPGSTLVKDFSAIQARKVDMEFFVDPLFKKTSAEFDEGGAKGLLLNHLCVDRVGRIIFDASDASNEVIQNDDTENDLIDNKIINIDELGAQYFPELFNDDSGAFDELHVCPFLKDFQSESAVLDIPIYQKDPQDSLAEAIDGLNLDRFDEDNDADGGQIGIIDVYNDNEQAVFGEVNAPSKVLSHHPNSYQGESQNHMGLAASATVSDHSNETKNYLTMSNDTDSIYIQFDTLMQKNWTGPSNWKIARLANLNSAVQNVSKKPKKEKVVTTIDFYGSEGEVDEDIIFAKGNASINLPKTQWSSKSRNLLPEDKHFSSESLLRLFLKPKFKIGQTAYSKTEASTAPALFQQMDENFWANQAKENQEIEDTPAATYDANFFQDEVQQNPDILGDDEDDAFEDAKQEFARDPASDADFGSQLQSLGHKVKPGYVNYAKSAKKVDVRVLKENIWDKLELLSLDDSNASDKKESGEVRKFTEVVNSLGDVYPEKAMSEISTSFCFICLLHLANEKGLEISGDASMRELTVRRDETVSTIESV